VLGKSGKCCLFTLCRHHYSFSHFRIDCSFDVSMIHGISFRDGCDDEEEEYIQNIKRGEEIDMVIEAYEHMICPPHLLKSRRGHT